MSDELFYIQDSRSYCGNSVMWWRVDGHGYTSNLAEAWKVYDSVLQNPANRMMDEPQGIDPLFRERTDRQEASTK